MPTLEEYRIALQAFQSKRLRRDHADLAAIPQYARLAEFFFNEMYGPHDFSERDAGARRVHQFLHLVPGVLARDVDEMLELLDLTNQLDQDLTQRFLDHDAPLDFDEPFYEYLYCLADNYDQRLRQIHLVRAVIFNMHRLTRIPLLGMALNRAGIVARVAGIGVLHKFLMEGYASLREVQDAHYFAETVYDRESIRLNRIYNREAQH